MRPRTLARRRAVIDDQPAGRAATSLLAGVGGWGPALGSAGMAVRWVFVAMVTAGACSGGSAVAPASTVPYTGAARELAPSQVSRPTVPDPDAPGRCATSDVEIVAAAGTPPDADVVVTFRNDGAAECEIDLGSAWAITHAIEPSVRLAPHASAELWAVEVDGDCPAGRVWTLTVNGSRTDVALPAGVPCALAPTAFFPV